MVNHNSISDIQSILAEEGITLKKRFGQNFLVQPAIRNRIKALIDAVLAESVGDAHDPAGEIWEIGPGIGSLTHLLVDTGRPLRLFEIDHGLIRVLRRTFGDRVTIEAGDFLKHVPAVMSGGEAPTVGAAERGGETARHLVPPFPCPAAVVGNLPYNSASAMIARIVESPWAVPAMVFLVQAELADRLAAAVGGKDYSALSVLVQSHYTVQKEFLVPASAFHPRPRVGSSVVCLRRLPYPPSAELTSLTSHVARRAFAQRRKTLRNTLKDLVPVLESLEIDPGLRPEALTPAQFRRIAENITSDRNAP